jgi:hypothetical protein
MLIRCDGTSANLERIRAAINWLKPNSRIALGAENGDRFEFDQIWPDGETVSKARWVIEIGQSLDTQTGAVLSATLTAE